jgi:hypothetical protein
MTRTATRESLHLFALAPVRRGEGRVRGTAAGFHAAPERGGPLTLAPLALSSGDRGEGAGGRSQARLSLGLEPSFEPVTSTVTAY